MTLRFLFATLAALTLLGACGAGTKVKSTRTESTPVAAGKSYRSVLVIAGGANMFLKEDAEQAVVAALEKHGADATEGMQVMGNRTRITREVVEPYLASGKYDAVLFLRATATSPEEPTPMEFTVVTYGAPLDYWYDSYTARPMTVYGYGGGAQGAEGVALATMFDVAERKAIWSETMKLSNMGNSERVISKVTGVVERGLVKAKLLPGR